MTITNKHVGFFIWFLAASIATYCSYPFEIDGESLIWKDVLTVFTGIHHIFMFVIIIVRLIDDDIEFEFYIPNPFKSIAESYRQKREYIKELNTIYEKMALAENNKELDFLIAKKEQLQERLGVGLPRFKGPPPPQPPGTTKYLSK